MKKSTASPLPHTSTSFPTASFLALHSGRRITTSAISRPKAATTAAPVGNVPLGGAEEAEEAPEQAGG